MWQFDFHIYYQGGRAVLAGLSPYMVNGFFHPYLMAVLWAPLALLPEPVAYWVYVAGCVGLLWRATRWRGVWALLSFPVWFGLFVGQVDLPMALGIAWGGPWILPIAMARPQLGFVVAPWLLRQSGWRGLGKAALSGAALLLVCFLLRPNWVSEWRAAVPTLVEYSQHDSNLYWLVSRSVKDQFGLILSALALPAGFALRERRDSWAVLHLLTPVTNIYSASVLAEWIGPLEVALSWAAIFFVGGQIHTGAPMFGVGLAILVRAGIARYRAQRAPRRK